MQTENIIILVDTSECATPLVCVPKTDGSVPLCSDYKLIGNRSIHTELHPIPTLEALAKLSGEQNVQKIDRKCAYQEMLPEKSQELATINNSRGLYHTQYYPMVHPQAQG